MSFGTKLKMLRIANKLDQDKMSKRLNVSQSVYSRYENNKKIITPSDSLVKKVAEEFGVTPQWLISSDQYNFIFKNNTDTLAAGKVNAESYYSVPKDFLDAFIKQQQITEKLLKLILERDK